MDISLAEESDLIVNTLPGNVEIEIPWMTKNVTVFEAAYFPADTSLKRQSERVGGKRFGGYTMFLHQAYWQFQYFTGRNIDIERLKPYLPN